MTPRSFHQNLLHRELAKRCEKNPRYSLRAFAKALTLDVATLSRVLAGKQIPSLKASQKIFQALGLGPEEQQQFLSSVGNEFQKQGYQRINPRIRAHSGGVQVADLSIDVYRTISDWYHVAILELTCVEGFRDHPKWIAKELGITPAEALLAVDRLLRLGLLARDKRKLVKTNEQLSTTDKHLTTPALRKHQRQLLEKAIHSLENDPAQERSITSMTMAIDAEKLPQARELIRDFNRQMCKLLESGKRERVYNLEISLYPLQLNKENLK